MNADQLERQAFADASKPCIEKCCNCGLEFNIEEDHYGESVDRETFVCTDCVSDFAKIHTIYHDHLKEWGAYTTFKKEEVCTRHVSESKAIMRAVELAEFAWDVKAYIEVG